MATRAAHKRLTREYANLQKSPPDYISARPNESNILEWHYILTGPPNTAYVGGQYWGTLTFPPDYPFAPPAIRMHTPSGRFRCSERLCLSISDFHPKSFNPAWEVSTILLGVLSFMTSEEMTTGSISASDAERKALAARTRWWNSTGGGSAECQKCGKASPARPSPRKAGDGGKKFRDAFPDIDADNWKWLTEERIDLTTGKPITEEAAAATEAQPASGARVSRQRRTDSNSSAGQEEEMEIGQGIRRGENNNQGWFVRNKWLLIGGLLFIYVLAARVLKDQQER